MSYTRNNFLDFSCSLLYFRQTNYTYSFDVLYAIIQQYTSFCHNTSSFLIFICVIMGRCEWKIYTTYNAMPMMILIGTKETKTEEGKK